jgi:hypothetical protein
MEVGFAPASARVLVNHESTVVVPIFRTSKNKGTKVLLRSFDYTDQLAPVLGKTKCPNSNVGLLLSVVHPWSVSCTILLQLMHLISIIAAILPSCDIVVPITNSGISTSTEFESKAPNIYTERWSVYTGNVRFQFPANWGTTIGTTMLQIESQHLNAAPISLHNGCFGPRRIQQPTTKQKNEMHITSRPIASGLPFSSLVDCHVVAQMVIFVKWPQHGPSEHCIIDFGPMMGNCCPK